MSMPVLEQRGTATPPRVSVLCLTYNHAAYIEHALEGLLAQSYHNLQVVIADDGSTDGTLDAVRAAEPRFPPGSLTVATGQNVGITANCNRALASCDGEFLALTAGDDVLLPGKIERQVAWFSADPRRVLCGHDVEVFESGSQRRLSLWSEQFPTEGGVGARDAVRWVPYCATAIMLRRSAMPEYGFDPRLAILSDWKLVIDCLYPDGVFGHIDGVFARYRRHGSNITDTRDTSHRQRIFAEILTVFALVDAQYPRLLPASRRARAWYLARHARQLWLAGDRNSAGSYLREAAVVDPRGLVARLFEFTVRRLRESAHCM